MLNLKDKKRFALEEPREFEDGQVIFNEGDDSREMYIVVSGCVAVSKKVEDGEILLAELKKGDFVGEMSLLESVPRSATARTKGKTKLLVIHPGGFLLKIRRDPTFAFEMLQTLSRRIRTTNDKLVRELSQEKIITEKLQKILTGAEFEKAGPEVSSNNLLHGPLSTPAEKQTREENDH